jgi:hypothetical protein
VHQYRESLFYIMHILFAFRRVVKHLLSSFIFADHDN